MKKLWVLLILLLPLPCLAQDETYNQRLKRYVSQAPLVVEEQGGNPVTSTVLWVDRTTLKMVEGWESFCKEYLELTDNVSIGASLWGGELKVDLKITF